jgi:hypothetical protein
VWSASTGSNNGTSWANAYTSLQPALEAATSGKQIWVARGTYKPTTGTDRSVSFQMKSGVKVYGGFAGTETSVSQRSNFKKGEANETILSGDIGTAGDSTDNCYHVIFNSEISNTALLDGFTITAGQADNYSVDDVTHGGGGGVYNYKSSLVITNCHFNSNYAYFGGAIINREGSPTFSDCVFTDNRSLYQGGAIFNYQTALRLNKSSFSKNKSDDGGAICNFVVSSAVISNSDFTQNEAREGAGIHNYQSTPDIVSCVFDNNKTDIENEGRGGGIYNYESSPRSNSCTFRKNSAKYGGAIYNGMNSSSNIDNCLFVKNNAEYGAGVHNFVSSPQIFNCTFFGNYINNFFGGAGVENNEESNPSIMNSIFQDNYRTSDDSLANIYGGNIEDITYCSFYRDQKIYPGEGNIYDYAAFTDTSGVDGICGTADDDFSLKNNSPCIGTGSSIGASGFDIRGKERGTPPDMGAYENELNSTKIKVIYVKASATGKNDGTSWTDAYTSLLPALNEASAYDHVWVAKGIYKPTTGTDRSISFSMKNMVKLYGGFAGTEAELSFRKNYEPGEANETILSGNIGYETDSTDNSYHVFFHPEGSLLERSTVIDGFTITGGYASGLTDNWETYYGGGMFNYYSSPTIHNCHFTNNRASGGGGAMFNDYNSSPEISNCSFTNNLVYGTYLSEEGGGGIYNYFNSSPAISYCYFEKNSAYVKKGSAPVSSGGGGGIFNEWNSSPDINHCRFVNNYAQYNGDGINYNGSTAFVTNSVFEGNSGDGLHAYGSGTISNCIFTNNFSGISIGYQTPLNIINCTFSKNTYGLISDHYSNIQVLNSIFWGNSPEQNSTYELLYVNDNSMVSHCCIRDGSGSFPGNNNIYANPLFADAANGDFHLSAGSPCISKGINPAENNLIPLTDLDGNSRPLGSRTDLGAYECRDDGTYPKATTFVISNEAPGYLIDNLIAQGYGDSCLYAVMKYLQPLSGGIIPQWFMDALAGCPAGSEIFTAKLKVFSGWNGPVCINNDGTLKIKSIFGKDYYKTEGYETYVSAGFGSSCKMFTYPQSPDQYIDAGMAPNGTRYKAFAIAWSMETPTTFVLSNEGGLIDNLIASGYGNSSLYEVLVALQPNSGGIISDEFLATLAHCPAGSDIFVASLTNFSNPANNPIAINTDGTAYVVSVYGKDYFGREGYSTYPESQSGVGEELFTYAISPEYYIDCGSSITGGSSYKAFAIVWSQAPTSTLSVSTSTLNVASANGSTASFNVTSNSSWTAIPNQTWLSVNPATGTGNSSITVTAQANPTTSTRTATVTVSGSGVTSQTVTVTQAARAATLSVSTNTLNIASANGSTATFNVTSNSSWSATLNQTWLSINPASGTGNGSVTVTAKVNPLATTRMATVTVSGSGVTSQTVTVIQAAGAATLSVSTNTLNIAASNGSTASFNVTSNSSWTAASNQTWLSVNPATGTGNGTVTVTAEANSTISTRTATVTVSGSGVTSQSVTITQSADAVSLTVSPLSLDVAAAEGSSAIFTVTSNTGWVVLPNETWLKVSKPFGSGNSEVMVTAEANSTTSQRTGTLVVSATGAGTQTVTVTQAAGAATLTVSPLTIDIAAMGGDTTITITSNTSWAVASNQSWLTVAPLSGSGNGTVMLTSEANPSSSARSATVTVSATGAASQTVLISQQGTVGVLDDELAKIRVYPNPFSEGFYVNADNTSAIVTILDMAGRTILKQTISSTQFIETGKFENGIYLIGITNAEQTIRKKMIKQ